MIDENSMREIEQQAKLFRVAIESCEPNHLPVTLQDFPRGSCGDASLLLAKHLQNQGIWPLTYVCGEMTIDEKGKFHSHAWLEIEDIIIDITADQFEGVTQQVIVTRDRSWHEQFDIENKDAADYYRWSGPGIDPLPKAFELILSKLKAI